jgi:serine protease Do
MAAVAAPLVGPAQAQEEGGRSRMERTPLAQTVGILSGSGAYLGVQIEDVTAERASSAGLSEEYGVYLSSVTDDGPAADAGLEAGDILVSWNGTRLESMAQLQRLVRETPSGRSVELSYMRSGARREATVVLGDRADARNDLRVFTVPRERVSLRTEPRIRDRPNLVIPREGIARSIMFGGRGRLGVSLQSLGEQLAEYFGVTEGALITSVSDDSPAEAAGLRAGDVIIEIDGRGVDGPGEVVEALGGRDAGPVDIRVVRDHVERSFTVEIEEGSGELGFAPMSFEGFQIGPIELDGFEMGPLDWTFELDHDIDPIEISIPRIEIPGFEIPMLDVPGVDIPGIEVRAPRVRIIA